MILRTFIFINLILSSVECFTSTFNHWHCIDLIKNIDKSKPYAFNVGELPLVTWFNNSEPLTTINICKHMGSKLDTGNVKNGCLTCPYHGLRHICKDTFGQSMIFEDKLWWSYEPNNKNPPMTPFYNNKNFVTTSFTLNADANIRDCMYNTFDIHHFAHVHSNIIGTFEPPKNYNFKILSNEKIAISYKYKTNKNIAKIKSNLESFDNLQIFKYPYTSSSIFTLSSNNEIFVVDVNMLPIELNKTKWIVTLKHNFWKSYFDKIKIDLVVKYILHQDQEQMKKQYSEDSLKNKIMNQVKLRNEEHFTYINKMFKNYKFPDLYSAIQLYEYHKNKELYNNMIL